MKREPLKAIHGGDMHLCPERFIERARMVGTTYVGYEYGCNSAPALIRQAFRRLRRRGL
jgi:hypothetical protein